MIERLKGRAESIHLALTEDHWRRCFKTEVVDFGVTQWDGRMLEGIVVTSAVQQKNRILGRKNSKCFAFALIYDAEYTMNRAPPRKGLRI